MKGPCPPVPRPFVRGEQVLEAQAHGKHEPQTYLPGSRPVMVWGRSMTLFFSCKLRPSGTCQGYRESGVAPGTQPGAPLGQAAPPPNQDSQGPQPGFLGRLEAKCLRRGEGGPALTGFHPWGGRWEIRLQSHLQMQLEEGARPPAVCVAGLIVGGGAAARPALLHWPPDK